MSAGLVAGTGLLCYLYVNHRRRERSRSRKRTATLEDLQGNFYATGSDIVRLYGSRVENGVFVVTGTTSGLGKQTALLLGRNGGHVIMGIRNPNRGRDLVDEIERVGKGSARVLRLDLSSLQSVKDFAERVKDILDSDGRRIDALINNAGVAFTSGKTTDGYQKVWQVNSMAPAFLTDLILESNMLSDEGRIVSVSSEMHRMLMLHSNLVGLLPPNPLAGASGYDYAISKACQILHAHALNDGQFRGTNRRAFATEPGLVQTNIARHMPDLLMRFEYWILSPFLLRTVDQGCSSTLFCALAPLEDLGHGAAEESGPCYYANCLPKTPIRACRSGYKELENMFKGIWAKL
jgi:NAD(P)-dependent dehydrogenase (short-subunit alcohol dehydrogenase family)